MATVEFRFNNCYNRIRGNTMEVRTSIKVGGIQANHNQAMKIRSSVKAGGISVNHNERLAVRRG